MKINHAYDFKIFTTKYCLLTVFCSTSMATNFHVNTTTDEADIDLGDGVCLTQSNNCSLRAAVMEANHNPDSDTIQLPVGNYELTLIGRDEDFAAIGDLDILESVQILGEDPQNTQIDGLFEDRVFDVHLDQGKSFELTGVSIINGFARDSLPPFQEQGGGVNNRFQGTVKIINSIFMRNQGRDGCALANSGTMSLDQVILKSHNDECHNSIIYVTFIHSLLSINQGLITENHDMASLIHFVSTGLRTSSHTIKNTAIVNNNPYQQVISHDIHYGDGPEFTEISNVTISNNQGDIILNDGGGRIEINNSSLINNEAGIVDVHGRANIRIKLSNTALFNNVNPSSTFDTNCKGPMQSLGGNVFGHMNSQCFIELEVSDQTVSEPYLQISPLLQINSNSWSWGHLPFLFSQMDGSGVLERCPEFDQIGLARQDWCHSGSITDLIIFNNNFE